MSKKTYLYRYLLIIKKVRQSSYVSFEDILDYVEQELFLLGEEEKTFSKRTFQRDLLEIEQMFNIEIRYDRALKGYYIDSENEDGSFDKMIEAFDIFQSMMQTDGLRHFFHFEAARPAGTHFLRPIIQAIQNRRMIRFVYLKKWDERSDRFARPLVLKEYKGRWYLFCILKDEKEIKTFALDRVETLFETGEKFSFPPDWDVQTYFKYCFGIYRPGSHDEKPSEVVFETNDETANYILAQPIHKSQRILKRENNSVYFSINTYITFDLIMELLSLGEKIKIESPPELQNKIIDIYRKSLARYMDTKSE